MAIDQAFLDFVLDQLSEFGEVEVKKMFGGAGLFHQGLMFGKVGGSTFRLKVDSSNQSDYEERGMKPYYSEKKKKGMPYWEVPVEILDDRTSLKEWAKKSYEIALRQKKVNPLMHRLDFLDKLRAIAQNGLYYAKDPFDRERYTQLMDLATAGYAEYTDLPALEIKERFARELGYITAKVGVQGVLINSAGEMLLEKRKDDGLWGLPSGWLDVGERPQEALAREFMEEAQLRVKVGELLGVYSRLPGEFSQPHTSVHLLYYCILVGGQIQISHESLEMKFVDHKTITTWHKDHQQQAEVGWSFWAKKIISKRVKRER